MQTIILRVGDGDVQKLQRALRSAGIRLLPKNQTIFGRVPFTAVATNEERIAHREAQCEMFAACKEAGLDISDREEMLRAINDFLRLQLSSRKQLTPEEMRAVTGAAASGFWGAGWEPRRF